MVNKILVGVSALVVVMVMFMATFGAAYIAHPKFTVVNQTASPIMLAVLWDGKGQPYGNIAPQQRVKFSVDAEAEMTLLVEYPDGTSIASQALYLTSGSNTQATIFEDHIAFE